MNTVQHAMLHHPLSAKIDSKFLSPTEPLRVALSPLAAIGCVFAAAGLSIAAACTNDAGKRANLKARTFACLSATVLHVLSPLVYAVQLIAIPVFVALAIGEDYGFLAAILGFFFGLVIAPFAEVSLSFAHKLNERLVGPDAAGGGASRRPGGSGNAAIDSAIADSLETTRKQRQRASALDDHRAVTADNIHYEEALMITRHLRAEIVTLPDVDQRNRANILLGELTEIADYLIRKAEKVEDEAQRTVQVKYQEALKRVQDAIAHPPAPEAAGGDAGSAAGAGAAASAVPADEVRAALPPRPATPPSSSSAGGARPLSAALAAAVAADGIDP